MKTMIPGKNTLVAGACSALLVFGAMSASAADDVFALQNALYGAGYNINSVDGQMGSGTLGALKAFQKDQSSLKVTGQLDKATKKALGMVAVDVAVAETGSATTVSANSSGNANSSKSAEPEKTVDDSVEEDDDGGWLFF